MMARRGIPLVLTLGCGVPVDIGVLDGGSTSDPSGVGSSDAITSSESGPTSIDPGTTTTDPEPPPVVRHDFAIRFADLPDVGGGTGTGGSSASSSDGGGTDGGDTDPDALVIRATTGFATCEDPYGQLPCPAAWTYGFALPPALQFVGATGRLEEHGGSAFETGAEPVECSFGGGTLSGAFEITAIDGAHVAGRMFDLELTEWETDVTFDAPRCG